MQSNGYCAPDASFLYPAPFFGHSYNEHMQAFPPADHRTWGMQNYDGYNAFPQANQRTWGIGDYNEYNAFPQANQRTWGIGDYDEYNAFPQAPIRTWGIGDYRVPIHSNAQNCNYTFPVEGAFGPPHVGPYNTHTMHAQPHPISSMEHHVDAETRKCNDPIKAARNHRSTLCKLKQNGGTNTGSASTSSKRGPTRLQTTARKRPKIEHSTTPIKMDNSNRTLVLLFEKELKKSDVGPLGRIVLPKKEAEEHLPVLLENDAVIIDMMDFATSNIWRLRYRYWPNNKSRMYILENTKEFVKLHGLEVGDFMTIYEDENRQKVIKATKVEKKECHQDANVVVPAPPTMQHETFSDAHHVMGNNEGGDDDDDSEHMFDHIMELLASEPGADDEDKCGPDDEARNVENVIHHTFEGMKECEDAEDNASTVPINEDNVSSVPVNEDNVSTVPVNEDNGIESMYKMAMPAAAAACPDGELPKMGSDKSMCDAYSLTGLYHEEIVWDYADYF